MAAGSASGWQKRGTNHHPQPTAAFYAVKNKCLITHPGLGGGGGGEGLPYERDGMILVLLRVPNHGLFRSKYQYFSCPGII